MGLFTDMRESRKHKREMRRLGRTAAAQQLTNDVAGLEILGRSLKEADALERFRDRDEAMWMGLGTRSQANTEKFLDPSEEQSLYEQSINFYYRSPHGRNAIRVMEKYVVGRGFAVVPKSNLPEAKAWWDAFWTVNKMDLKKKEVVRRTHRDGESFLRFFEQKPEDAKEERFAGMPLMRFIDPARVQPPTVKQSQRSATPNTSQGAESVRLRSLTSLGIETDPDDIENVLAYWIDGARVDSGEIQHNKIFADSDMKRGRPYSEAILPLLGMYKDYMIDRMKLNKVRAAVALIKKVSGTPSQVQQIASKNLTFRSREPDGDQLAKAPEGVSLITTNQAIDYEFKTPNLQAADVAEDGRQVLLAMSAGLGLAEFVLTSDASNANFACYSADTELLTETGWRPIPEVERGELVATMNPDTFAMEYQPALEVMAYPYVGEMVSIRDGKADLLVTPNHTLFAASRWRRPDLYRYIEARHIKRGYRMRYSPDGWEFGRNSDAFMLPEVPYQTRPELDPGDRVVSSDDWLEFLGYWIAEGSCLDKGGRCMVAIQQSRRDIRAKIRALLERLPFGFRESGDQFYTFDKSLWTWLRTNCGIKSHNLAIPELEMSRRQASILFEALMDGDGHRPRNRRVQYYDTVSKRLADDVQVLAMKLGYATKVFRQRPAKMGGDGYRRREGWRVSIRRNLECEVSRANLGREQYSGRVHCVEVENHLLVVRRNGKTAVAGNSTLVAEAPSIKELEDWQEYYGIVFGELYSRVIDAGVEAGKIPETEVESFEFREFDPTAGQTDEETGEPMGDFVTRREFRVVPTSREAAVSFPELVTRDMLKETQALQLQGQNGWVSDPTASAALGYNFEEELERQEKANELRQAIIKGESDEMDAEADEPDEDEETPDEDLDIDVDDEPDSEQEADAEAEEAFQAARDREIVGANGGR